MKKLTFTLLVIFAFVSCSEDDFVSNQKGTDGYISFATHVDEMSDINRTRGGGHYNPAHTHEMTGAATPMFARFTQESIINKYLKASRQGAQEVQDNSPVVQVTPPSERMGEASRARRIDTSADFYDAFGLISFMYAPSQTWSDVGSTLTPYVYNEKVRKADQWRSAEYWPGSGRKLTFFAYAPYNADGVTLSPSSQTGTPWLHYEVPLDTKEQSDLLISANEHEMGNYNAVRHIDFRHVCAGVRFGIGSQMAAGTIKKIQLADVYGEGWYHFGASAWDSVKTEKTFTLNQTYSIAKGEQNKLLTTGDDVFMMVPQEVPFNGRIIVTIDDGVEHELVAYVTEDQWDIGTTTTYWLSTLVTDGDTILSVAVENAPIAATGGTAQYEISSYYTTAYGTRTAIPWTAYYTIDNDTTKYYTYDPEALQAFTFSGGSSPVQSCNITALSQIPRSVTQITRQLQQRPKKNEDLAIGSDKKGTANCYVVNNPGTYTFPIVYGSCLDKNGNTVSSVYSSDNFVNHAGTKINTIGPKVPESEIDNVCIVWQDAAQLVTPNSLEIVDKNGFKCVQFTVDSLNICEGNCLIAVRNSSNTILWSYHIWVTHHDMTRTFRVNNNNNGSVGQVISYFAPVPLGYCERDTVKYAARKFTLNVIQTPTNDTARVVVNQQPDDAYIYGVTATYYQWGRKDPMPPSNGLENVQKKLYDNLYSFATSKTSSSIANAIQKPNTVYSITYGAWLDNHVWNLWNLSFSAATSTNNTVTQKTVYDPSIAGFCLPSTGAFTGFNTSGTNENTNACWQTNNTLYGPGCQFPTRSANNPSGNPTYVYFPAFGWININSGSSSGSLLGVCSGGRYWTSGASTIYDGHDLKYDSTLLNVQDENSLSYGYNIWPVAE